MSLTNTFDRDIIKLEGLINKHTGFIEQGVDDSQRYKGIIKMNQKMKSDKEIEKIIKLDELNSLSFDDLSYINFGIGILRIVNDTEN